MVPDKGLPLGGLSWTGFAIGGFRRFGSGQRQRFGFFRVGRVEAGFFFADGLEFSIIFDPFEADAGAPTGAGLQANEVAGDFLEFSDTPGGVADGVEGFNPGAPFGDEDAAKGFKGFFPAFALLQFVALLDDALDGFLPILVAQPFLIAAVAPFAEVLLGDAFSGEQSVEDVLDFGMTIEPIEDGRGEFGVLEPAIEFFADFPRDAGDFSGAHRFLFQF